MSSSSQLRLDPLTGRWVVITTARARRPHAFVERSASKDTVSCPFCPDSDVTTPPDIATVPATTLGPVRAIPNRYPAFEGNEALMPNNLGPVFLEAQASGSHEVLVFSPAHELSFADLPDQQINATLDLLCDRLTAHESTPAFRYTQVIINHGREAGASLAHPHAQLLAIPFVPGEIQEEQAGFVRFGEACLLCATIESEEWTNARVVLADDDVIVICPFWSGRPYEMMVLPRRHSSAMHHGDASSAVAVGQAIKRSLRALRLAVGDVAYNLIMHISPFASTTPFHWHVHVAPQMTTRAGFELGTGVPINIVSPETAAVALRAEIETNR